MATSAARPSRQEHIGAAAPWPLEAKGQHLRHCFERSARKGLVHPTLASDQILREYQNWPLVTLARLGDHPRTRGTMPET
jgi:hypothetical protein